MHFSLSVYVFLSSLITHLLFFYDYMFTTKQALNHIKVLLSLITLKCKGRRQNCICDLHILVYIYNNTGIVYFIIFYVLNSLCISD